MAIGSVILCISLLVILNDVNGEWLGCEDHMSRWDEIANKQGTSLLDQFSDNITLIGNGVTLVSGKDAVQSFLEEFYSSFDNVKYLCGEVVEDLPNVVYFDFSIYYYKAGCINDIIIGYVIAYFDEQGLMTDYNYVDPPDQIAALFAAVECVGGGDDIILPSKPKKKCGKEKKGAYSALYVDDKNFMQMNDDKKILNHSRKYQDPLFIASNVLCVLLAAMVISLMTYIICDKQSRTGSLKKIHDGNDYETTVDVSDTDI